MDDIELKKDLDNVNVNIETPNDDSNIDLQKLEEGNWGRILNNKTFKVIKENFRLLKQSVNNLITNIKNDLTSLQNKTDIIENSINAVKTSISKLNNNSSGSGSGNSNINEQNLARKDKSNIFTETNTFQDVISTNGINNNDGTKLYQMQGETITLGDISRDINIIGKNKDLLYNGEKIRGGGGASLIPDEIRGSRIEMGMHPYFIYGNRGGTTIGSNDIGYFNIIVNNFKANSVYKVNNTIQFRDDMVEIFNDHTVKTNMLPLGSNKGVLRFNFRSNGYEEQGVNCGIYYLTFKEINFLYLQALDLYNKVRREYIDGENTMIIPEVMKIPETLYKVTFDFKIQINYSAQGGENGTAMVKTLKNVIVRIPPLKKGISINPPKKTLGLNYLNTTYSDNDFKIKLEFLNIDYMIKDFNFNGSYIMIMDKRGILENKLNATGENNMTFYFYIENIRLYYKDRSQDNWDISFKGKNKLDLEDYYEYLQYLNSLPANKRGGVYYNE